MKRRCRGCGALLARPGPPNVPPDSSLRPAAITHAAPLWRNEAGPGTAHIIAKAAARAAGLAVCPVPLHAYEPRNGAGTHCSRSSKRLDKSQMDMAAARRPEGCCRQNPRGRSGPCPCPLTRWLLVSAVEWDAVRRRWAPGNAVLGRLDAADIRKRRIEGVIT